MYFPPWALLLGLQLWSRSASGDPGVDLPDPDVYDSKISDQALLIGLCPDYKNYALHSQ